MEDTFVQVVDGIIVGDDDEEIKMLFFYKKPGIQDQCRAVVEFRTSLIIIQGKNKSLHRASNLVLLMLLKLSFASWS